MNLDIFKENKDIILDTGIYIEYFEPIETELKTLLRKQLFSENSELTIHGHYLLKSELFYILCRKIGKEEAEKNVKGIEEFVNFVNDDLLCQIAGLIKCKYPIALSDCFSISLGIFIDCPVLFLKERELSEIIVKNINKEFNAKIYIFS